MKAILSESAPDGRTVAERGDILVLSAHGLKPAAEICAAAVAVDPFLRLARREAENAGLQAFANATTSPLQQLRRRITRYLHKAGVRVIDRSPLDVFMEHFSRRMKANDEWRKRTTEYSFEFPPGATWIVFTDVLPHAVVQGGIALEQTVIVPRECMAE